MTTADLTLLPDNPLSCVDSDFAPYPAGYFHEVSLICDERLLDVFSLPGFPVIKDWATCYTRWLIRRDSGEASEERKNVRERLEKLKTAIVGQEAALKGRYAEWFFPLRGRGRRTWAKKR
jgi:hypothetical protein